MRQKEKPKKKVNNLGKPLFEMCCALFFPYCLGVKGLAGMVWGTFFHVWLFDRGGEGGLKLFGQCPY